MARLNVVAAGAEGLADPGDQDRALIAVSVSDANGVGITALAIANFDIHMAIVGPGGADVSIATIQPKTAGFYVLGIIPIPAGTWKAGRYVATVAVHRGPDFGQTLADFSVA